MNEDNTIGELENKLKELKEQKRAAKNKGGSLGVPGAIILGSALISAAIFFGLAGLSGSGLPSSGGSGIGTADTGTPTTPPSAAVPAQAGNIVLEPVDAEDHVYGSRDATVSIVEFSDTECPFCARVHPTIKKIVDDSDGTVNWVYRHFPLDQLHRKARREAEATECANELGGNDGFWTYIDRLFEITPSNDGLADEQLSEIAEFAGLNRTAFETCLESGKYADHVASDVAEAAAAGGSGTPYSVILGPDGETFPVSGAQPAGAFTVIIDSLLQG